MCGIIGCSVKDDAVELLLEGLERLEYRGYDSSGVAVFDKGKVVTVKSEGRIANTRRICSRTELKGCSGIGHTRWATHGRVSRVNAHPHTKGRVTVVHNGIIENYRELYRELANLYTFESDTDTEIACALIDRLYTSMGDPIEALAEARRRIRGSFAVAVMFSDIENCIYAMRRDSPLLISCDERGCYLASDMTAIPSADGSYYRLSREIALLKRGKTEFYINGERVTPEVIRARGGNSTSDKEGFPHFMLKEIYEEPQVIERSVEAYLRGGFIAFPFDPILAGVKHIRIIGCGTALHAGMMGAYHIERMAGVSCRCEVASEFRYNAPENMEGELAVFISQSGETADTIAALRLAKRLGALTLGIVNVPGSTAARESDMTVYTSAGQEIAVASTKAYSSQLAILYLLAVRIAQKKRRLSPTEARDICEALYREVPVAVRRVIESAEGIETVAKKYAECENIFYIGRGRDHLLSEEASLKLKEISYIHSEAYPAGELKHGTISLVTERTPVIAFLTDPIVFAKTVGNVKEVRARGARVLVFGMETAEECEHDDMIALPETDPLFAPFTAAAAFQLFAYYVALHRGCDIDKPRNLAKSVTVE